MLHEAVKLDMMFFVSQDKVVVFAGRAKGLFGYYLGVCSYSLFIF